MHFLGVLIFIEKLFSFKENTIQCLKNKAKKSKKKKKEKRKTSPNNDFQQKHFLDFQLKEPMMKQYENFALNFS